MQYATIEDTVYFHAGTNDTAGSGDDGASAVYDVRLCGAAAGAAPVLSGNATLLSHASYPDGCYEVAVAATVANGFAAGSVYAVFFTLAVDGQNPTGYLGTFKLGGVPLVTPAEASGRPTTLEGMIRRIFEASPWGNKRTRNRTTGVMALRNAADGADLVSATQSTASPIDTQTQGA